MEIKLLPEHVANQIAAGEVVEGPYSVVKELVENSVDAEAQRITIEIKNSNRFIKVADNGKGMSAEDLELAFKRHATSKIADIKDLESLDTNGFRGEALASIASVSKLTCISKREQDENASKLYIENGEEKKSLAGASKGTSITIDELFFNTPARLKFLKSGTKERNQIIDMVRSLALAHPEIKFELSFDKKNALKTSGSSDLKLTISELFSSDLSKQLNPIEFNSGDIKVTGYCASPDFNRSDKRGIFTLLNKRSVKCYIMSSAIEAVYKELMPSGKHPIAIVFLDLPSNEVDVNVHPTKKEVKYSNNNKIYTSVGDAVSKSLSNAFYENNEQYQRSIKEEFAQEEVQEKAQQETIKEIEPIKVETTSQNLDARPTPIPGFISPNPSPKKETAEKLDSEKRKFISRLGSVDVSVLNQTGLKTVISQQGNKTNYEIIAEKKESSKSVLLKGDFIGENWIKDKYLSFLDDLAHEILEDSLDKNAGQNPLGIEAQKSKANRSRPNKKPGSKVLEKIWERDNYTCVYCQKNLLHPNTTKDALPLAKNAFKTHLNQQNKEVTINILSAHTASFDHHLPASKFGVLNTEEDNLYASCIECNKLKSDSMAHQTWEIKQKNSWKKVNKDKPLTIAGVNFSSPKDIV